VVNDPETRAKQAAEAYAEGDRLWQAGQPEAALASLVRAIALRPEHPNAKNFAGWLLTTRHRNDPRALAQGLALLAEAHALAPDEHRPLQNLVEALVGVDRRADARTVADAAVAARPDAAQPLNLRGWLRGLAPGADDPKGAMHDLEAAIDRWRWYGDAHLNLGLLLLGHGEEARARAAFTAALRSGNCWRPLDCHLRLGEIAARRGHLRRALGHFRRGAELDSSGGYMQAMLAGVQACGGALLQSERYFLHAIDEARRQVALETGALAPRPAPLRSLAKRARALIPRLTDPALQAARAAVEQVLVVAEVGELPAKFADDSPALVLELAAGSAATPDELREPLQALASRWIGVQRSLYDELLAREESDPEDPESARARIVAHATARRWAEALAELAALDTAADADLLWRAANAETYSHRAHRDGHPAAQELYRLALRDHEQYASGATSGGEGMARMVDVERLRRSLPNSEPDDPR
jgi:tetratricopeptide (TPR) repeat protein